MTPLAPTLNDAAATTNASSAKLDAIFQSLRTHGEPGEAASNGLLPVVLLVVAVVLAYVAITHWHRQRQAPKPLRSHKKLLTEAARSATVSRRQMKRLTTVASEAGLSSPLVALICPSAIHRMASHAREESQRTALRSVAQLVVKQERKAAGIAEAAARKGRRKIDVPRSEPVGTLKV